MGKNNRITYIDVTNCIAIFFVLVMHSAQLAHFGSPHDSFYKVSVVLQLLCVPAVYMFFMNSGATLLDYRARQNTKDFFFHRLKRVFVPFVFWSVLFYLYDIKHAAFPGPIAHPNPSVRDFAIAFSHKDINNIFWFFYAILALYLVTPIFSLLVNDHKDLMLLVVVIFFVFNDGIYYLDQLFDIHLATKYITQPLLSSSYIGYFILGYLIKVHYIPEKLMKFLFYFGFILQACVIVNLILDWEITLLNNIGPFFYAISFYLLIIKISNRLQNNRIKKCFASLSGASLGIYILHPVLFVVLDKLTFGYTSGQWNQYLKILNNPVHIFILPIISYILLTFIILFLKKNRFVRILIP